MRQESAYELLDSGGGRKLERFGAYILARPCAQAVWEPQQNASFWQRAHASFERVDGNRWHNRRQLPGEWPVEVDGIKFKLSDTDFGHLGIFPEQRVNWQWIQQQVRQGCQILHRPLRVLNLFAYSGGSTLAAALAGAEVCHLDASRGMVQWARENAVLNNLAHHAIRWIVDDAHKFLHRELRRKQSYDAVILDPPTFGRGQASALYKIEKDLPETLRLCRQLLSKEARFVLLSAHTPGYSPIVLQNVLSQAMSHGRGLLSSGEMLLEGQSSVLPTPSGAYARWERR